jgi:Arc/MetJ family transcription regulator
MKPNVRRTSLNLDMELVAEVREELGTRNTTDTVHAALRDVARRAALRRLAEWDFEYLTPERLEEMRRPRTLDPDKHWPGV